MEAGFARVTATLSGLLGDLEGWGVDKYSKDFMWDVDPLEWKEELKSLLRNAFLGQGRTHAFLL